MRKKDSTCALCRTGIVLCTRTIYAYGTVCTIDRERYSGVTVLPDDSEFRISEHNDN